MHRGEFVRSMNLSDKTQAAVKKLAGIGEIHEENQLKLHMMRSDLPEIIANFETNTKAVRIVAPEEGFINETFFVQTEGKEDFSFILQKKNSYVFHDIPGMMRNIHYVTEHLKKKIPADDPDFNRKTFTLIPTREGEYYHKDKNDSYWTLFSYIPDSKTYDQVQSPEMAFAGGEAIGNFQSMLVDFDKPLVDTIPDFHNIPNRLGQWERVLDSDPLSRKKAVTKEIGQIVERRQEMLDFQKRIDEGIIPSRIAHNDTKISNVLFDERGQVLCMIDLDTVMRNSVLFDFGDAVRTYTNTGKEDERKLQKIQLDLNMYEAFTRGYLAKTKTFLCASELDSLAFSARYITYEQALRFLTDYINGDKYYKILTPNHNLHRTKAQLKLLQSMEESYKEMEKMVKRA